MSVGINATDIAPDLTELRIGLYNNGYRPVPVLGANAVDKDAGKRPTMRNWQTVCATAEIDTIAKWTASQPANVNTGLLCGTLAGVDIDVLDQELVDVLVAKAEEILGPSPLRRTGYAPKTLFCYRTHVQFNKIQTPELFFPDGSKAKVEILGTGNQFVGFGVHPNTRKDYQWHGASPFDTPFNELPVVEIEDLKAFIIEAEQILRDAGGRTAREIKDAERGANKETKQNAKRERQGRRAGGFRQGDKPGREEIADALEYVPNDLAYDDWVRIGFALYDGLGDAGRDLWEGWSAKSSKNDAPFTARKWPSFAQNRSISIATLFYYAKDNGWRRNKYRMFSEQATTSSSDEASSGEPSADRPTIRVCGGNLPAVVTAAEDALIAANLGLYQRGSMVVRPTLTLIAVSHGRRTEATRIIPVRSCHVAEMMTRAANIERFDMRSEAWVAIDCPARVADTYMAREGQWRLPILAGIINCPTLRPDGSVLDRPGYDAATGLLYQPQNGVTFSPVIDQPTKDQAAQALVFLLELIETFPFVSGDDRAVAMSAILTSVVRRSLLTAPLHGFTAPVAGTGKSLLIDIASEICDGRPAAVISAGKTEEEMEKRLGAALIAGDTIISIDNVERPIGGELICQALTQRQLKVRILGQSVLAEVPTNCAVFANGNNLTFEGDIVRRALLASLDAGVERPELRKFKRSPIDMIRADRDSYVNAALTVLRAHHFAGRPDQPTPLGSFEDWSGWVRGALIWLGMDDPCVTMEKTRIADPKLAHLVAVISQWDEVIGTTRVSAKGLIDKATAQTQAAPDAHGNWSREFLHPEFREALLAVAGDGSTVSSRRLGRWLSLNQNRLVEGKRIVVDGNAHGIVYWRVDRQSSSNLGSNPRAPRF
jgi:putative DNA primase/helicase